MAFDVGEVRAFLRLDDTQFKRAVSEVPGQARAAGSAVTSAMGDAERATGQVTAAAAKAEAQFRSFAAGKVGGEKLRELEALGVSTRRYLDAVTGVPGAQADVRAALRSTIPDADKLEAALRDLDKVTAQASTHTKDLEARQRALGNETEQASVKVEESTKKMGASGKAFAAVGGLIAGVGIVSYAKGAIDAASDLNETMSKSSQIFEGAAGSVAKWGEDAAKNVGLSKAAAIDAAAGFGNMFTQLGFTSKAAADLSTKTVQMSADLGSFNNQPTAEVADKISAAFRGEYDSLQAMIPTINAAKVEQEAMSVTGKKNADQLTAQEKAQAVLTIINRDGAKAMGDFARTADGYANSTKTMNARIEEQKAALGDKLLPVAMTVMQLFSDVGIPALGAFGDVLGIVAGAAKPLIEALGWVVDKFTDLPQFVQVAIVSLTAVALLHGPLTKFGSSVVHMGDSMTALGAKATKAGALLKAAFISNPIGLAITAIATAVSFFTGGADEASEATERWRGEVGDLKGTLDQANGSITDLTKKKITDEMIGGDVLTKWKQLGIDTRLVVDGITGVAGASERSTEKLKGLAAGYIGATRTVGEFSGKLSEAEVTADDLAGALLNGVPPELNAKLEAVGLSLYTAADGQLALKNNTTGTSQAINDAAGSLDTIKQAYDKANGLTSNLATAQGELAMSAEAAGSAFTSAERPVSRMSALWVDGKIDAGELKGQVDELMLAIDRLRGINGDAEAAQRAVNAQMRDYAADLRGVDEAAGRVKEAQDKYNEVLKTHKATSDEAKEAARNLADAQDAQKDSADKVADSQTELGRTMATAGQTAFDTAIAQGNLTGATDAATEAMRKVRDAFIASQSPADIASGKAAELATKLGLIPEKVATNIQANSENAVVVIDGVEQRLDVLDGKIVTATVYADFKSRVDTTMAQLRAQGNPFAMHDGGVVVSGRVVHAAAGMIRSSDVLRGGENVVHAAESSLPWEAYVSGDPNMSGRSNAIMGWTAGRLGGKYLPPGVDLPGVAGSSGDAGIAERLDRLIAAVGRIPAGKYQIGENVTITQGDIDELFYRLQKQVQNR